MNSISDIKSLIEMSLEDLKDDEVISEYAISAYRETTGSATYKIDLYVDGKLISRQMGFGNGYNAKINAWRRLATHLIQHGIVYKRS